MGALIACRRPAWVAEAARFALRSGAGAPTMAEHFDLLIRGGTLVDGTGAPARPGDVAIRDGRIAALGAVPGAARRVLDAEGAVVAPGFVDIHTHYDAQVFWDRMLTISPWHGVTSVVMGNCGFGVAPTRPAHRDLVLRTLESVEGMSLEALRAGIGAAWPFESFAEFLAAIERRGTAINAGALVGHTPVRLYVMGEEATEREASDEEIAAMRVLVRDALRAGALGFARSRRPTSAGRDARCRAGWRRGTRSRRSPAASPRRRAASCRRPSDPGSSSTSSRRSRSGRTARSAGRRSSAGCSAPTGTAPSSS